MCTSNNSNSDNTNNNKEGDNKESEEEEEEIDPRSKANKTGELAVISIFDLFSIGVGPSSSHTVGPMRSAKKFIDHLKVDIQNDWSKVKAIQCELFGSLACTGIGHHTDYAILMGLEGHSPESIDPKYMRTQPMKISKAKKIKLNNEHEVPFEPIKHLLWRTKDKLPFHTNGMRFTAYDSEQMSSSHEICLYDYYSIGGGFVTVGDPNSATNAFHLFDPLIDDGSITEPPMPFTTAAELIKLARAHKITISELVWENERQWRSDAEIRAGLLNIWSTMNDCIINGIATRGLLQTTSRRAADLGEKLLANTGDVLNEDWLYCWSMAVNEENAGGGRVVTAPTNGAAGVIPAIIKYYTQFNKNADEDGICSMLLTAAAIGMLYKRSASISAAEVGCQGEIGVAASMAAAALAERMGGTLMQVESAAEIAMEHSLGTTCDPIGGYVEIPCIERNALGATKALAAARIAMYGDGHTAVSLDAVIRTMRDTGRDMMDKYKETSEGGLAINVPSC